MEPKLLDKPDFSKLEKLVKDYVDFVKSEDYHEDNDYEHYIYEEAMEAVYGKDFWNWFNYRNEDDLSQPTVPRDEG